MLARIITKTMKAVTESNAEKFESQLVNTIKEIKIKDVFTNNEFAFFIGYQGVDGNYYIVYADDKETKVTEHENFYTLTFKNNVAERKFKYERDFLNDATKKTTLVRSKFQNSINIPKQKEKIYFCNFNFSCGKQTFYKHGYLESNFQGFSSETLAQETMKETLSIMPACFLTLAIIVSIRKAVKFIKEFLNKA